MRLSLKACALASMLVLAGCDTTSPVAQYSPSTGNVLAIQSTLKPFGKTVQVEEFAVDAGVSKPGCRMVGGLDITPGKSLPEYMKDALQSELFAAGVYDVKSPAKINARLTTLKVNTFGTGSWTLGMDVSSNLSRGYHVEVTRPFASSYMGEAACHNAVNAFAPTVQALFAQMVNNPGFILLAGQ